MLRKRTFLYMVLTCCVKSSIIQDSDVCFPPVGPSVLMCSCFEALMCSSYGNEEQIWQSDTVKHRLLDDIWPHCTARVNGWLSLVVSKSDVILILLSTLIGSLDLCDQFCTASSLRCLWRSHSSLLHVHCRVDNLTLYMMPLREHPQTGALEKRDPCLNGL